MPYPPQGAGVSRHTLLTDKEVGGVIDHANLSVTDAKIASGVGVADTQLLKLPVAPAGKGIKRGVANWELADFISGVTVRKDSGSDIGTRPRLNVIEGAGLLMAATDDPVDDEVDITVASKYAHWIEVLKPEDAALPTANPAALATVDGINFAYKVLDFDPTTEESASWEQFMTPDYLYEHLTVDIFWLSAGAGNVKFGFRVLGKTSGETFDDTMEPEAYVVQTNAGVGILNKAQILTMPTGWSPSDVILFKLARKAGDAEDTIDANDVRVVKVVLSLNLAFGQSFFQTPQPFDVTPAQRGVFATIDVSTLIPPGATGVILHYDDESGVADAPFAIRPNGSSWDQHYGYNLRTPCHFWCACGVDATRKFQAFISAGVNRTLWLIGYTGGSGVVWFTDPIEKDPGINTTWVTMNATLECPNAIGIIWAVTKPANDPTGIRKLGSTDDRTIASCDHWLMIGCDVNQQFQLYRTFATEERFWIMGYVKSGAYFYTNAPEKSPVGHGAWEVIDCSAEAPNSVMLFFEVTRQYSTATYGIRKKDTPENIVQSPNIGRAGSFVGCDANQKIEGQKTADAVDVHFWLNGYATSAV
jgi:hypothetical protein